MTKEKYDRPSVGKLRFALGVFIAGVLVLFTLLYFDPSFLQLALGFLVGAMLFLLRRHFVGNKRFESRRAATRPGFLALMAIGALVLFIAIKKYVPYLEPETVWIYLALAISLLLEWLEGFRFYARDSETADPTDHLRK